jgi:hypothetical protein
MGGNKMDTGFVLGTGIMGISLLFIIFILAIVLKIQGAKIKPHNRAALRFCMIVYSIMAFIYLIGSGIGVLELCPIPILRIIQLIFTPVSILVSAIYANKSKRFKPTE